MRVIFVNRFYWPETPATGQLLTDLAEGLAAAGHHVTVITSRSGNSPAAARETRAAVHIRRMRATRWSRLGFVGKAVDYLSFFAGSLWRLFLETRRGTLVVAMTDPPMLGVGTWLVSCLRNATMVHWVQDIYPEVAIELTRQRWLAALRPTRNRAWRSAAACVTVGEDMARVIASAGVKRSAIHVIENWAPAELASVSVDTPAVIALRDAWSLTGKFVVAYSGNLGRVHDLDPILDVATALSGAAHIAFIFIGAGPQRNQLETEARRRGLNNVTFRPAQPREQLATSLGIGDVHLVTLREGCERLVFPSKLYGAAAIGRPVLFIGPKDSEMARILDEHRFGWSAERHATAEIVGTIARLARHRKECARMSAAALRFAATHSAANAIMRWRSLLDSLQACDKSAPTAMTVSTR